MSANIVGILASGPRPRKLAEIQVGSELGIGAEATGPAGWGISLPLSARLLALPDPHIAVQLRGHLQHLLRNAQRSFVQIRLLSHA